MHAVRTSVALAGALAITMLLVAGLSRIDDAHGQGVINPNSATPQQILQAVLDHNLSSARTMPELLAQLSFDDVFAQLTPSEVIDLLFQQNLIVGYGNKAALLSALPDRDVDLSILRPDGVLSALASAYDGSIIVQQADRRRWQIAPDAKTKLRNLFATQPLTFLGVLSPLRMLEVMDARLQTSVFDARTTFYAHAWTPAPSDATNILSPMPMYTRSGGCNIFTLPSITGAVLATSQMPTGNKSLRWGDIHRTYGCNTATNYPVMKSPWDQATVQTITGATTTIDLPWMDTWEAEIAPRIDGWFRDFKAAGGQIDIWLVDQEDYEASHYPLFNESVTTKKMAPNAAMAAVMADPRWTNPSAHEPPLRDELARVGLTDFTNTQNWHGTNDYRTALWNRVIQRRRTASLNRAVISQMQKYFPNVKIGNYNDTFHTALYPANWFWHISLGGDGIGHNVGNHQQPNFYGGYDPIVTPDGNVLPVPTRDRIAKTAVSVNASSMRLTMWDKVPNELKPGDRVRLTNHCTSAYVNSGATVASIDRDALFGTERRRIITAISPDRMTVTMSNNGTIPYLRSYSNVCGFINVKYYDAFDAFTYNMRDLRTGLAASNVPMIGTMASSGYTLVDPAQGNDFTYYGEMALHMMLGGVDYVEYWNTMPDNPDDHRYFDRLLKEAQSLIGFGQRHALPMPAIGWQDGYVLSGMDAGGRIVWRFTPDPRIASSVTTQSGNVILMASGATVRVLPHSRVMTPANEQSTLGTWIVQEKPQDLLRAPAAAVLRAISGESVPTVNIDNRASTPWRVEESRAIPIAAVDASYMEYLQSNPLHVQGTFPQTATIEPASFTLGTRRGQIYVLRWKPQASDVGSYSVHIETAQGAPRDFTLIATP